MNFKEYVKESERTMINKGFELNVHHACLGIITETAEIVDQVKKHIYYGKELDLLEINKEIGDVFFYIAILYREFPDLPAFDENLVIDIDSKRLIELSIRLNNASADFVECFWDIDTNDRLNTDKKYRFIYIKRASAYQRILISILNKFMQLSNISLDQILEMNIAKLKARYPEKFTAELALNRDLEKENEVLYKYEVSKGYTV